MPFEDFFKKRSKNRYKTIYAGRIIRKRVRIKISLSEHKCKLRLVHYLPVVYLPAVYDDGESG